MSRKLDIKKLEGLYNQHRNSFSTNIKKVIFVLSYLLIAALQRIFDIIVALLCVITVSLPVLFGLWVRKICTDKNIFVRKSYYGKEGIPKNILLFNLLNPLSQKMSFFFYVITGDLGLTGVSLRGYDSQNVVLGDAYLLSSKPGIFNLWIVRQSSKIAHEGQQAVDWEYVFKRNFIGDILLILKSVPAYLYYEESMDFSSSVNLFGIHFDNFSMEESIGKISKCLAKKDKKTVCYVNPDCLNKIFSDQDYYDSLQTSDYIFPDGIGVHVACKILKTPLKENINGTDMFPFLCEMAQKKGYSIFLLGGQPGIAEKMKTRIEKEYPTLQVAGVMHGYFDHKKESNEVVTAINNSGTDILFVAFGAPLQEKWIVEHRDGLYPRVVIGVGGLFDFMSKTKKRAPRWMREIGFEWFYRFMQEPGRMWRRYFVGNPLFILRVLRWKYFSMQIPQHKE